MKALSLLSSPVRFGLFAALSFLRPVVMAVLGLFAGLSLFGLLFCLIAGQWFIFTALLVAGIVSTAAGWAYDALLNLISPFDFGFLAEN